MATKTTAKKKRAPAVPGRGKGRPTVMTKEKQAEILAVLVMGGSRNMAADYVGIGQSTLHNHIERDATFCERVKEHEAKGQLKHLQKVGSADQWQASAWMLERKWPDEFGRRERKDEIKDIVEAIEIIRATKPK